MKRKLSKKSAGLQIKILVQNLLYGLLFDDAVLERVLAFEPQKINSRS